MLNYSPSVTNDRIADPRFELIDAARYFYRQNWMVGTAGNLSARIADDSFWITASGKAKGELTTSDFVRVALDGEILGLLRSHYAGAALRYQQIKQRS